ncbi:MAG TPA: hypothetical protein VM618_06930, partial [Acidimicrobiia bacterium]|nr:hypothetical protein [Acidimicrobiia bacterium]
EVMPMPSPTALPFALALGLTALFVGILIESLLIGVGGALGLVVVLVRWLVRADGEAHHGPAHEGGEG